MVKDWTLEGHIGTIWSIDVDADTILCATGEGPINYQSMEDRNR